MLRSVRWAALGTTASVVCAEQSLARAREAVEAELAAIDLACSRFRSDSELARVNAARGRPVRVSPLFGEALSAALWAAAVTRGAVDPTIGRVLVVAGYDRDFAAVRDSGDRLRTARVAGWRVVRHDRGRNVVRLPTGVQLDLGATAKALAADRAARAAATATGAGVLVNLGGDISTAGPAPAGGWVVRVCEDHRDGPGSPGETVTVSSGGLATSSTTVRNWRRGSARAHHIVDPGSGRPARVVWRTVTVAAATCVEANTASTAAIVRGGAACAELAALGLPARLVARDGAVTYTHSWPVPERVA